MICISLFIAIGAVMVRIFYKEGLERKKQLNLARSYDRLVLKNKLSIEETHVTGSRIIGLDRKNKKLLLINHSSAVKQEECVALEQLDSCTMVRESDEVTACTTRLVLELKLKRNKGRLKFVFFDESEDKIMEKPSLVKRAEYWKRKIDRCGSAGKVGPGFEFVL
jgi:hypothetical protein